MTTSLTAERQTDRRRVIERPRLTRMLDATTARVILLTAPAGYGKTTLAQQWLAGHASAWYRSTAASADVAAFAPGVAIAAAEIVPGADIRLRERLRATNHPEAETDVLAELLAEDLAGWPPEAWLAIDDYQFAMESMASELFVQRLSELAPVRLFVTSRNRPRWATARRVLYGEIFELERDALAMSDSEAEEVLGQRAEHAPELVERAQGWPAVIGLAALTDALTLPDDDLPATLYDYFAEEVYLQAEPAVRWGLCHLAMAPTITTEVAHVLFGKEVSALILQHGVRLGVLIYEAHGRYGLHPLLRTFLEAKLREYGPDARAAVVSRVQDYLLAHREWDDAFALTERWGELKGLEALIENSLEVLLHQGRVSTLERWVDVAQAHEISSPVIDLAAAEVAFRRGEYRRAETLALRAARHFESDHALLARAYSRAGQSASLGERLDVALGLHRQAERVAQDHTQLREAVLGQLHAAIELELDEIDRLGTEIGKFHLDDATSAIRLTTTRLFIACRIGDIDDVLRDAKATAPLLPETDDPLVRAAFLHTLSVSLGLVAQYDNACQVCDDVISDAMQYRLAFVLPYAYVNKAIAEMGRRQFRRAEGELRRAESILATPLDAHTTLNIAAVRLRLRLAQGLCDVVGGPDTSESLQERATPTLVAEYFGTAALCLACRGNHETACELADRADRASKYLEGRSFAAWARVVSQLATGSKKGRDLAVATFREFVGQGFRDSLVSAYRGYPPLLTSLRSYPDLQPELSRILVTAHEASLLRHAELPGAMKQPSGLSRREVEVHELLAAGLSNKEIAQALFIAEPTVKAHVRHIFRKLGVRSRTEAAMHRLSDA
jgi:LuxR family maltose regulon positive regulatory protein